MAEERENAIEWIEGADTVTVTLTAGRLQNRVLKLASERPDDVEIRADPKTNHGFLVAHLPVKWIRFNPPAELSEETRRRKAEMMMAMRMHQKAD